MDIYSASDSSPAPDFWGTHRFDQRSLDNKLVVWIITAEQPFTVVDHPAFKAMINDLQPRYKIPTRIQVAKMVWALFHTEKPKLMTVLRGGDSRVSITTDTWTSLIDINSVRNVKHLVVTAHFLDGDWNFYKRVINFAKMGSYTGEELGRVLDGCLSDWGIQKVFSVTVNDASVSDKAVEYMKRMLKSRGTLFLDGIHLQMRCACDIIKSIVKDGLNEYLSSIVSIRNCVWFIHSSQPRLDMFRSVAVLEKLDEMAFIPMDDYTRWNATYVMLSSAFKYKDVFARMAEENEHFKAYFQEMVIREIDGNMVQVKREGPPVKEDWEKVINFAHFLKKFCHATVKLSATKTPTSNLIFVTMLTLQLDILNKIKDHQNPTLQSIAEFMKTKFEKYWGSIDEVNPIIYVAQALDPRFKFDLMEVGLGKLNASASKVEQIKDSVKQCFSDLLRVYKEGSDEESEEESEEERPREVVVGDNSVVGEEDDVEAMLIQLTKKRKALERMEITNDADRYFNDPFESLRNSEFNLLEWWKSNSSRYPILSKIAKDVFALPSSTVACENAFSLGGKILDRFRSFVPPKTAEALVCTTDWLSSEEFEFDIDLKEEVELVKLLEEYEMDLESQNQ